MKCPYCGTPYHEDDMICPSCGQPLSNAHYTPVNTHPGRGGRQNTAGPEPGDRPASAPKPRRKRRKILIILFVLLLLAGGGAGGYLFYLHQVTRQCQDAVRQIFSMAASMDFSSVDPAYLPPALQENPDVRAYVRDYVDDTLADYGIDTLLEDAGLTIDTDELCDEILQSASYTITGAQTSYNRCTVSVHTENTDFSTLPEAIAEEVENSISGSSFWDSLRDLFSSLFSGHRHEGQDGNSPEEEPSDEELFASLYDDFRETAPVTQTDGTVVFGIADGKWTLLSMDEELLYSYYGLTPPTK